MDGWKGNGLRVAWEHHFLVFPARPGRIDGRMAPWVLGWFWAETTTCEIIDADARFFFHVWVCEQGLFLWQRVTFFSLFETEFKV